MTHKEREQHQWLLDRGRNIISLISEKHRYEDENINQDFLKNLTEIKVGLKYGIVADVFEKILPLDKKFEEGFEYIGLIPDVNTYQVIMANVTNKEIYTRTMKVSDVIFYLAKLSKITE